MRALHTATDPGSLVSSGVSEVELDLGGVLGDRHHGMSARSSSRQARFYPCGTQIRTALAAGARRS